MNSIYTELKAKLGNNLIQNEPLKNHTTLKIGGPAEYFFIAEAIEELVKAVKIAKKLNINVTLLGRGSNILISDKGLKGLVIKNMSKNIIIKGEKPISSKSEKEADQIQSRWQSDAKKGTFKYEFSDLDYDETDKPKVEIIIDSGVDLSYAIFFLIQNGITGLQWYAGIPGTIGGAVFNNIHGGTHFLSEVITSVKVLTKDLKIKDLSIKDLGVEYDKSRFHNSGEIILQTTFSLFKGDTEKAKATALEWAKRKSIQPRNSAGCTFANITNEEKEKLNYPTTSVGYIVEHVIGMSGFEKGDAIVSKAHHNFIENRGNATASDYLEVVKEIMKRTKEKTGIKLVPEIFFLGFEKNEVEGIS